MPKPRIIYLIDSPFCSVLRMPCSIYSSFVGGEYYVCEEYDYGIIVNNEIQHLVFGPKIISL